MVDYARILDETAQEYQGHRFIDWPMDTSWYDDFGKVSGEAAEFESNQDYGGFQKSLDLLQSMVGSYGMSVGKGLEDAGLDTVGKWLFSSSEEIYDRNIEAASQSQRKRYEETEGFGEKAEWFVETLKEQSLMTGVPIAVGFGGQALTKMLIATPHPLVKAAGFMGAAALASYVLQTGEAYSSQMQKGGRVDASAAHTAGVAAALLDVLTPAWLFGKIPGVGNALKRNISEKILSGSNIGKKILTGLIASLSEGETERLQESLIEASVNYANDLPLFEFDEEQRANIREAVYAGRAMGGTIGTLAPRGVTGAPVAEEVETEVSPTTPTIQWTSGEGGLPVLRGEVGGVSPQPSTITVDGVEVPITEPTTIPVGATPGERVDAGTYSIDVPTTPVEAVSVTATEPSSGFEITIPRIRTLKRVVQTDDPVINFEDISYTVDQKLEDALIKKKLNETITDQEKRNLRRIQEQVGGTAELETSRTLTKEQRREVNRELSDRRRAESQAEKDRNKKLKEDAETEAHNFIDKQLDEAVNHEEALDTANVYARELRSRLGNVYADQFINTYNKRWKTANDLRKRREADAKKVKATAGAQVATGLAGEKGSGRSPSPETEDKGPRILRTKDKWKEPIVTDEGITVAIIEQDGRYNVVATDTEGNEIEIGNYELLTSAQRKQNTTTQNTLDKIANKAKAEELKKVKAEQARINKAKKEKDAADAKKAEDDKRAADLAKAQAAEAKGKESDATEDAARKKAEEDRRAQEIKDKAVVDEEVIPEVTKSIDDQTASDRRNSGKMTAEERKYFVGVNQTAAVIAEKNNYSEQYNKLDQDGKNDAIEAFKDARESWIAGGEEIPVKAANENLTWEEFIGDAVTGDIDVSLEVMGDETTITETDVPISDEFLTEEETKVKRVLSKKEEGRDRTLIKKKTPPKEGTRGYDFPTDPERVLNLDSESFIDMVDSTEKKGGYKLAELRTIVKGIKTINQDLAKPGASRADVVMALKLWYGSKNSPTQEETTTDEDVARIIDEVDSEGNILFSRRRAEPTDIELTRSEVKQRLISQLHSIFGAEGSRNMQALGFVNFVTRADVTKIIDVSLERSKIIRGWYSTSDGHVYFVLDNLTDYSSNDFKGLILHELSVHFGKDILTDTEWTNIKKVLLDLYVEGDPRVHKSFDNALHQLEGSLNKDTSIEDLHDAMIRAYERGELTTDMDFDLIFEETLAYFAHENADTIQTGATKGIWATIQQAVRRFFTKLAKKFDPDYQGEVDITSDDIIDLIAHMTMHVPDVALARYGDTKAAKRIRKIKLKSFLEGSVVKIPQYHGTQADFSFPVLAMTELGMHFGREKAAIDRLESLKKFYPERGSGDVKAYYLNIKKPLIINRDIGVWDHVSAWYDHTFNREGGLGINVSPLVYKQWQSFITKFMDRANKANTESDLIALDAEFSVEFIEFWKARGFDGIKYRNSSEGVGKWSHMIFSEEQVSPVDSYSFNTSSKQIKFSKSIGGTLEDASKAFPTEPIKEVTKDTILGNGRSRATWESIRKFFEPFANIKDNRELMMRRYEARGEASMGENIAKNIYDIFEQATASEKTAIFKYLTTRNADPKTISDRKVSYATRETIFKGRKAEGRHAKSISLREAAVRTKEDIKDLGDTLVELGLLTDKRFNKLKEAYLPKVYLRYLLGDEYRSLGAGMKPSRMDYVKARKLHDQWVSDVLLGEVKDPGFLASRYMGQVSKDIAIVKYLNWIVENTKGRGWVLPAGTTSFKDMKNVSIYWLEAEAEFLLKQASLESVSAERKAELESLAKEMMDASRAVDPGMVAYDSKNYKQVPNQPRYGAMRGIYIRKEIYDDMMGIAGAHGEQSAVARFFTPAGLGGKTQQVFKYTRVIANPPTLSRNLISNMVLLHTSGVSMFKIPSLLSRSMNELVNNGKYYKIAQKYGVEVGTFTNEEIRRIDIEFLKLKKDPSLFDKLSIVIGKAAGPGSRFYQKSEVLFKVAKIIDGIENKGLSEAEASLEAQDAILDYSLVSPSVRFLRSVPFGAPFITFQVKVLPQLLKNLRKNPLSFAPYVALPYIMATWFAAENEVDEEDVKMLKKHMGDWARDRGSIYFFPGRDENGKWKAIDVGYFFPWTAWFEASKDMMKGEFGDAWQDTGLFSGPVDVLKGLESNVDPFTQQPIWNESDPPQQQYQDILIWMSSYMVPPFMSPRNKAGAVTNAGGPAVKLLMATGLKEGNIGRDGLPKYDVPFSILSFFGFNTYTLDPQWQLAQNVKWMTKDRDKIQQRMLQLLRDPSLSQEKREELAYEYVEYIQNKSIEIRDYVDSVKGIDKRLYGRGITKAREDIRSE